MDDALATDSETGNSTEYQLPTQFQSCNNHTRLLRPYALAVSLSVLCNNHTQLLRPYALAVSLSVLLLLTSKICFSSEKTSAAKLKL